MGDVNQPLPFPSTSKSWPGEIKFDLCPDSAMGLLISYHGNASKTKRNIFPRCLGSDTRIRPEQTKIFQDR